MNGKVLQPSARHTFLLRDLGVLFFVLSYSFLAYKLYTFNQYDVLAEQWRQMPLSQFYWLTGVLILLPLNWYLETLKWKLLVSKIQDISMLVSFKSVLTGVSTGFFTPNRVGELVGRVLFLEVKNRKPGMTLCVLSSFTQNIIMVSWGIPASILFFTRKTVTLDFDISSILLIFVASLSVMGLIYLAWPFLNKQISKSRYYPQISAFTFFLSTYTWSDILPIMLVSLLRYLVFCTQMFLMLRFFGVEIIPWHAMIAIPASYLFVTFTPSVAFSEAAVRSSYAVLFIGAFSGQVVGIALAGVCIWVVNLVIPMLVGSVVMVRTKPG
jgi:hypothetical protein